jgi:mono/diheme cytochrome c family protein
MRTGLLAAAFGVLLSLAFPHLVRADDAAPGKLPPENVLSAPTGKEEPKPTQAQFDEGKRIFQNRCARCHGWNMVNLGSIAFDLRQFPHDDRVRFFHSVTYGKKAMPTWKDILTQEDIANIWAYVRTGGQM